MLSCIRSLLTHVAGLGVQSALCCAICSSLLLIMRWLTQQHLCVHRTSDAGAEPRIDRLPGARRGRTKRMCRIRPDRASETYNVMSVLHHAKPMLLSGTWINIIIDFCSKPLMNKCAYYRVNNWHHPHLNLIFYVSFYFLYFAKAMNNWYFTRTNRMCLK